MRRVRLAGALAAVAVVALGLPLLGGEAGAATFTVTKTADTNDGTCDADCSLREAVVAANAAGGADQIVFSGAIALPATFTLTLGELQSTDGLTITGPTSDPADVVVDAAGASRVINTSAALTIQNLTVTGGNVADFGAGILSTTTVAVDNAVVTANTVTGAGGFGGGINASGLVTLTDAVISDNSSETGGGVNGSAGVTATDSVVSGNDATGGVGGGINTTTVTATGTTFTGNTSAGGGAGFFATDADVSDSTFDNNDASGTANGGGAFVNGGAPSFTGSTFTGNDAPGAAGGLLLLSPAGAVLENSTFNANGTSGVGGGLAVSGGTVGLTNVTIAGNTAAGGGGIFETSATTVTVTASILASNTGANCSTDGAVADGGYNLVFPTGDGSNCTFGGTTVTSDPLLDPLALNAPGTTETMALQAGSPAIDAVDAGVCPPPMTDQRGVSRPQSTSCDIGAYEAQASLSITKTSSSPTVALGGTVDFTITVTNAGAAPGSGTVTDSVPVGLSIQSISPEPACSFTGQDVTCSTGSIAGGGGSFIATVTVQGDAIGDYTNTAVLDGGADQDSADVQVQGAVLSITKTSSSPTVALGGTVDFTITVTNSGNIAGSGTVTDSVPVGLSIQSISPEPACSFTGQDVTCATGSVPGSGGTFIATVTVQGDAIGDYTNTAVLDGGADQDSADVQVQAAVLSITKTSSSPTVALGGTVDFTITVTNSGNIAGSGTVTDSVPAGLSIQSISPEPACSFTGQDVTCATGSVPGSGGTFIATVTVQGDAIGDYTNTAVLDGGADQDSADVQVQGAVLSIDKVSASPTVALGGTVDFTITVTNSGNIAGSGTITDSVPAGLSIQSISPEPACSFTGQDVTCNTGSIPGSGGTFIATVTVQGDAIGDYTNTAVLDGGADQDSADVTVQAAVLSIDKSVSSPTVALGGTVDFTITVTNSGNIAGSGAITDSVPAGLSIQSISPEPACSFTGQDVTCSTGSIAGGGGTLIATVTVQGDAIGDYTNTAVLDGGADQDSADVQVQAAVLSITKTSSSPTVALGGTVDFTITVTNSGNIAGSGTVTDAVPAGLSIQSISPEPACSFTGQDVTCATGSVPGSGGSFVATVTVQGDAIGDYTNTAVLDGGADQDSADVQVQAAVLSITKTSSSPTVALGGTVDFTITVTNSGNIAGSGTVTDSVPAGLSIQSISPEPACSFTGQDVTCATGSIPGSGGTFIATVTVQGDAIGDYTNTAVLDGGADQDSADVQVQAAVLSIDKSVSSPTVALGGTVDFTITVTNSGNIAGSGTITDSVPAGLSIQSISPERACSFTGQDVTCATGSIAGSGGSFVATVTVQGDAIGDYTNTAVLDGGADQDSADVTVQAAVLSIDKVSASPTVALGGTVDFTITVTNSGNIAGSGTITDSVPVGLSIQSISPEPACSFTGQDVTCATGSIAGSGGSFVATVTVQGDAIGDYTNTAVLDGGADQDSADVQVQGAVLSIDKVSASPTVALGGTVDFTITVTNSGNIAGSGTITDSVPAGLSIQSISPEPACSFTGQDVTCATGSIAGSGGSFVATVTVQGDAIGDYTNTAVLDGGADQDSANVSVTGEATLTLEKTASPASVELGGEMVFTLTVRNTGTGAGSGALSDAVPAGLTVLSVSPEPACSSTGQAVGCDTGSIAPGGEFVATVTVRADEAGSYTNVAALANGPQVSDASAGATVVSGAGGGNSGDGSEDGGDVGADTGSSLPRTGADLALLVAAGLGMVAAGVVARRSRAARPTAR